jgi:hypothetical protein
MKMTNTSIYQDIAQRTDGNIYIGGYGIAGLIDIQDVDVNQNLPVEERIIEFIKQIKNPYLFKYGNTVIRVNFSKTNISFEDRVKNYFEML